jgi:hypothetical protein
MLIGIVSDTHGFLHPALARAFADVDVILHAGDVGTLDVLEGIEAIAPVQAVFGNVDGGELRTRLPEVLEAEIGGLRVLMMHIAGYPGRLDPSARAEIKRASPDMFICGHSHILQIERLPALGNLLFVNPGAAGHEGPHERKTCVRIRVADGRADQAEVIHLDEYDDQTARDG